MLRPRKRYSVLSRMPGGLELLRRRGALPWASSLGERVAQEVVQQAVREQVAGPLDIVISTGPALEPWNPNTLRESGLGGSETMAWELGRQLVLLGHRVRVFAHCAGLEGTFDGVEWLSYRKFRDLTCDVLLASRQPAAVDDKYAVAAKVSILWSHDVHCGDRLTPERDQKYDAYFCLSAWHAAYFRGYYPHVDAAKVIQVRNGIDPSAYRRRPGEQRDPLRAVYSSSPSRGLQIALDVWPMVRARVPGATLHVFYGFESWEALARLEKDEAGLAAMSRMIGQIATTEGVVYHGKLNPERLAAEFRISGVWAYPNWFHETSCITAMQAQAAGLRIVSSARGALSETVGERGVLLTQDPNSTDYREAFVEATSAALIAASGDDGLESLRQYAEQHFDLASLTLQFVAIFRTLLARRLLA